MRATPAGASPEPHPDLVAIRVARLATACAVLVALLATSALLGWGLDIAELRSLRGTFIAMNPATAIALLLGAGAVAIVARPQLKHLHHLAIVCAAIVLAIGAAKLLDTATGKVPVDRWLFAEVIARQPGRPNRIAPNTATCLVLLGSAILCLRLGHRRSTGALAGTAAGLSVFAVVGYVYGTEPLHTLPAFIPMALNTAVSVLLLALAVFCATPGGVVAYVLGSGTSGIVARRLLPVGIVLPVVLGWVRLKGQQAGVFGLETGLTLTVASGIVITTVFVWWSVQTLADVDARRRGAELELKRRTEHLNVLQRVTSAANAASTFRDALQTGISELGRHLGWSAAHAATAEGWGSARVEHVWWTEDESRASAVEGAMAPGAMLHSLVPRVLASRSSVFIDRLAEAPIAAPAPQKSFDCAFGFPVLVGNEVIAVIELFGSRRGALAFDELVVTEQVAQQLGRVAERQRVDTELRSLADRLGQSNRDLQDFAAVASHDLQEPLRKIQAFGERLGRKHGAQLGDEGRDYLERMRAAAARMQRLISDVLAFSRVAKDARPFGPVDLTAVANDAISDLETRIQQTGGQVELAPLPAVDGDSTLLRQLFQNLVGNALKFHREGVPPHVRIEGTIVAGDEACEIRVQDNGIGFDEKYIDKIFTVFQRLHGRGVYEGSGIGLAVCRRIVEHHGGRISATSTPGEGSAFLVTLPTRARSRIDPS